MLFILSFLNSRRTNNKIKCRETLCHYNLSKGFQCLESVAKAYFLPDPCHFNLKGLCGSFQQGLFCEYDKVMHALQRGCLKEGAPQTTFDQSCVYMHMNLF